MHTCIDAYMLVLKSMSVHRTVGALLRVAKCCIQVLAMAVTYSYIQIKCDDEICEHVQHSVSC